MYAEHYRDYHTAWQVAVTSPDGLLYLQLHRDNFAPHTNNLLGLANSLANGNREPLHVLLEPALADGQGRSQRDTDVDDF